MAPVISGDRPIAPSLAPVTPTPKTPAAAAPMVVRDQLVRTTAPTAAPAPKADGKGVPGELLRSLLAWGSMLVSPVAQASQTLASIAALRPTMAFLQRAQSVILGTAAAAARWRIIDNPIVRGAVTASVPAFRALSVGILAFDLYSAFKTFTDPSTSTKRKAIVGARLFFNALATGLCFVPRVGTVLSMPPAWISIGLDGYLKYMNAKGQP